MSPAPSAPCSSLPAVGFRSGLILGDFRSGLILGGDMMGRDMTVARVGLAGGLRYSYTIFLYLIDLPKTRSQML
jgi:hypothetical protein